MVTDYFKVKFYFSIAFLNSIEHIYYFSQQKIKRTDMRQTGFKFQSVLFSL